MPAYGATGVRFPMHETIFDTVFTHNRIPCEQQDHWETLYREFGAVFTNECMMLMQQKKVYSQIRAGIRKIIAQWIRNGDHRFAPITHRQARVLANGMAAENRWEYFLAITNLQDCWVNIVKAQQPSRSMRIEL